MEVKLGLLGNEIILKQYNPDTTLLKLNWEDVQEEGVQKQTTEPTSWTSPEIHSSGESFEA